MKKMEKKQAQKKSSARERSQLREFQTMSQQQNRYGKGRERSGSDGSSTQGRGSNH